MGPRSADRGKGSDRAVFNLGHGASMGPRSADRGKFQLVPGPMQLGVLQWGRDQLIAERPDPPPPAPGVHGLQWGRDQLIAERLLLGDALLVPVVLQWG